MKSPLIFANRRKMICFQNVEMFKSTRTNFQQVRCRIQQVTVKIIPINWWPWSKSMTEYSRTISIWPSRARSMQEKCCPEKEILQSMRWLSLVSTYFKIKIYNPTSWRRVFILNFFRCCTKIDHFFNCRYTQSKWNQCHAIWGCLGPD